MWASGEFFFGAVAVGCLTLPFCMQIQTAEVTDNEPAGDVDANKPKPRNEAYVKLFRETAGDDNEIDWMELKRILDITLGEGRSGL